MNVVQVKTIDGLFAVCITYPCVSTPGFEQGNNLLCSWY